MESVSLALAFAAGVLSFVSPCVLALVPVYLAFLGEAAGAAPADGAPVTFGQPAVLAQAVLFVAGFTAVFMLFGTSVGLLGSAIFRVDAVRQAAGLLVVLLGVISTGAFGPILDRLSPATPQVGLPGGRTVRSFVLGALVAVGWTPCIGPVLGAILTMGLSAQSVGVAALLLLAYSLGVAVPFLAAAAALPRMRAVLGLLRRHHRPVQIVSGLFIVAIGLLILTNAFARLAGLFTFVL
jgi:cytochrome c-type biogenesis protein